MSILQEKDRNKRYCITISAEIDHAEIINAKVYSYKYYPETAFRTICSIIDSAFELFYDFSAGRFNVFAQYTDLYDDKRTFNLCGTKATLNGKIYEDFNVYVDGKKYIASDCAGYSPLIKYDEFLSLWIS